MAERITPTITFQREPLATCLTEAKPLLEQHWREIAHYPDIDFDPDYAMYEQAEVLGALRVFTVRSGQDLVGYAVFFARSNAHYRQSLQAVQDILYLDPALRGGLLGARFIQWCDEELRKDGVQVVYQHVKLAHDFGPLLERFGYERIETVYGRRLDRERRR